MPTKTPRRTLPLDVLTAAVLLTLLALLLLALKNPTSLDDGLRHFTMANMMRQQGIFAVPGWNIFFYEGYLSMLAVDPWFLSDVALIPFTLLPISFGLHLFIACEVGCLLAAFLLLLRTFAITALDRTVFLLLLIFGDIQFTDRFLLGRPYALVTALLLFACWCIVQRRWFWLSVVICVSILFSQLFVFLLAVCGCGVAVYLLLQKIRYALTVLLCAAGATALGILLHPHPLNYVQYLVTAFLRIPFLKGIGLSREMESGVFDIAFVNVAVVCACIVFFLAMLSTRKKMFRLVFRDAGLLLLLIASIFFAACYFLWLRAIDVLWPILLLLLARVYAADRSLPEKLIRLFFPKQGRGLRILAAAVILLCGYFVVLVPYSLLHNDASRSLSPYHALDALPAGSRVLNPDWDYFFGYVATRPDLKYATGIDRTFTYLTNPGLSSMIYFVEQNGKTLSMNQLRLDARKMLTAYPSDDIVLSTQKFQPLINALKKDPSFGLVSENDTIAVFSVPQRFRYSAGYLQ